MSLKETVESQIKEAMKARNQDELRALRAIKSAILLEETKEGSTGTLSADDELRVLTKAAKQRKESAEIYEKQNRPDLAETERAEIAVIERFLPKALSPEELEAALRQIMSEVGASTPADMGKVMGRATKDLAGKADGKVISETVKRLLASA